MLCLIISKKIIIIKLIRIINMTLVFGINKQPELIKIKILTVVSFLVLKYREAVINIIIEAIRNTFS